MRPPPSLPERRRARPPFFSIVPRPRVRFNPLPAARTQSCRGYPFGPAAASPSRNSRIRTVPPRHSRMVRSIPTIHRGPQTVPRLAGQRHLQTIPSLPDHRAACRPVYRPAAPVGGKAMLLPLVAQCADATIKTYRPQRHPCHRQHHAPLCPGALHPKVALRERPAPVRLQISHAAVKLPDLPPDRHRAAQPMAHAQNAVYTFQAGDMPERPHDVRVRGRKGVHRDDRPPQVRPFQPDTAAAEGIFPQPHLESLPGTPGKPPPDTPATRPPGPSPLAGTPTSSLCYPGGWPGSTPASGPLGSGASNTILQNKGHSVVRSYRAPFLSPHLTVCHKKGALIPTGTPQPKETARPPTGGPCCPQRIRPFF